MTELDFLLETIKNAKRPRDIFGTVEDDTITQSLALLKYVYRKLATKLHPDQNGGDTRAADAFVVLQQAYEKAQEQIANGTYERNVQAEVKTKKNEYLVMDHIRTCGIADVFECLINTTTPGEFHLAHRPRDNDLMQAEATSLEALLGDSAAHGFFRFLPDYHESLIYKEGGVERRANAFAVNGGEFVTLEQALDAYPDGVHAKDMVWIYRRLLDLLGYVHHKGIIHGAVVPSSILIGIGDNHEMILTNWQNSVTMDSGRNIPAIVSKYRDFYPPEVTEKKQPSRATDNYMAAKCMRAMIPAGQFPRIQGFLMSLMGSQASRDVSSWGLRKDFTELADSTWKREYRPFYLPT
jgi:hypothetical protein